MTADVVSTEILDGIGLIALNNPPVNAACHALRHGLNDALASLIADPQVQAIALYGATRAFIAGADIREFGQPPRAPLLPEICLQVENSRKPVLAILHGPTLGGGLEVALSAHARIALPDLVTGFPEVTLGILPGAGGTQRAPRLIGIAAALDLITTGRRIGATEALDLGLIDRIADGTPRDIALHAAQDVLAGTLRIRRTADLTTAPDPQALARTAADLRQTQPHLFAPHECVQAIAYATGPLPQGLARERAHFDACIASPQRAGLIHAFFAERAVAKIPERDATPHQVAIVGVVGAGTMGSGIATALLLAGLPVVLTDRDAATLAQGIASVERNLAGAVKRGKLTGTARDDLLANSLTATTDLTALATADLVIEAVFEDMAVKQAVFRQLDSICKPGALLASNTSYLDIDAIAAVTNRPQGVLGLHFFSPAHIMRLVEVVVAKHTSPEATATGFALARRLGKVAVRARGCDGFIGNRILARTRATADHMVLQGTSPFRVDQALEDFGFAMGPFRTADLAGLDIGWAMRKRRGVTAPVADRLCENGWIGRKAGQGYYLYDGPPQPNPAVARIIEEERAKAGIGPRDLPDDRIVARTLAAMIAEAANVLQDGIALRPIDIDAVLLFGYGFPRWRGGPMHHADNLGPARLLADIDRFGAEDPGFPAAPDLLRDMARTGVAFADMNAA